MPDAATVNLVLYSPRWGRDNTYVLTLNPEKATFSLDAKSAVCVCDDGSDPVWSGYGVADRNPVESILENDSIYPPSALVFALERVWQAWKEGGLDNKDLQQRAEELCNWVNGSTGCRPKTAFWRSLF